MEKELGAGGWHTDPELAMCPCRKEASSILACVSRESKQFERSDCPLFLSYY